MFHFIDVPCLDRRNVITVIDPEMPLGLLEDFRHEVAVWTAAVEIIVPGPYIVQARGYAPHRCRLAFGNRVLSERRIDADMHVSIDATRERQEILGVEHLLRLLCRDIGGKARDLSILDRDVETIDRRLVGAHHAGVLDYEVERLFHSRVFLADVVALRDEVWLPQPTSWPLRTEHIIRLYHVTGASLSCCPRAVPEIRIVCRARASPACRSVHSCS